ncbi:uncharacterized protein (TIGR02421 family) [Anseongella ginsenosidimutans]|uniref:Uncharacterized protein (TIGR02421 family) n=1 Tax=Anseongella ginsenosidimutans TaxID=496056 RepID=A0A4R3KPF2_9SPHI|nr:tyrosine/phenylalanine carboxypeptidase domain-containing protein [Anseongella ginsenosidimutans]QEC53709.1 DUF1704 domain-containing protein [Anseongella ginsenosidimutans]TCS86040.1 uncharacterized protein (TIGR02421 family) [Anseongella ginsenosidimutans]
METGQKKIGERILNRLKKDKPVHVKLPGGGIINMDSPVPFLLVYRMPPDEKDLFTLQLGKTESSYLMAEGSSDLSALVNELSQELADRFGAFMLLEVWVTDKKDADDFTVHFNHEGAKSIAESLQSELDAIRIGRTRLSASLKEGGSPAPPYFSPVLNKKQAKRSEIIMVGLEIKPIYINPDTGRSYPLFLRELRKAFGKAVRKTFFEFIRLHTSHNASHFEMLGKTVIEDIVWDIDKELAGYSNQFNFLFLVTPVNLDEAWKAFEKSDFRKNPVFHYRPMPIDPELIKRKLYNLPIEKISDPTIAFLFRDKRKEIDRMLNMMAEREKPDFMHSSLQLFGRIDDHLVETAQALLVAIPPPGDDPKKKFLTAEKFAAMARAELKYLQKQCPDMASEVHIREDIEGILVSRGVLWISDEFKVSRERAKGLIQHEVGTHIVTYYNGKAQPFRLFYTGVPGYEQLQEGLAVLAEYIMDGLTNQRLRTLAARVVAVDYMVTGHSFVETFHLLRGKYHFPPKNAFTTTMRAFRGGGLTKDAVYLKGFLNLLEYIRGGRELEPLLIGKIQEDYLPIVEELIHRKLLKPIPVRPRYLEKEFREKTEILKKDITIFNMIG